MPKKQNYVCFQPLSHSTFPEYESRPWLLILWHSMGRKTEREQPNSLLLAGLHSLGFHWPDRDVCAGPRLEERLPEPETWSLSVHISEKDFLQFRRWGGSNTLLERRKIESGWCIC